MSRSGFLYALIFDFGFDEAGLGIVGTRVFSLGGFLSGADFETSPRLLRTGTDFFCGGDIVIGVSLFPNSFLPDRYSCLAISESISTSLPPTESITLGSKREPCITRPISFPETSCKYAYLSRVDKMPSPSQVLFFLVVGFRLYEMRR